MFNWILVTNVEYVMLFFSLSHLKVLKVQSSLLHHGWSNPLYIYNIYSLLYIYIWSHTYIYIIIYILYYVNHSNGQTTTISPSWSSRFYQRYLGRWEAQPFPLRGVRRQRQQSAASVDRDASSASMALHCWAYARSWRRQRRFGTV